MSASDSSAGPNMGEAIEWSSLISYYLSCLKHEDSFEGLLQRSDSQSRYVFPEGPQETVFSYPDSGLKVDKKVEKLVDAARLRGETLFYGYPVVLLEDNTGGTRRRMVGCLMVIELSGIPRPGEIIPKVLLPKLDEPFFHPAVLSKLGIKSEQQTLLAKDRPPDNAMRSPQAVRSYVRDLLEALELKSGAPIEPTALTVPGEGDIDGIGVHNTAIVFRAASSDYNRRLIDELQELQARGAEAANTAAGSLLGQIVARPTAQADSSPTIVWPIAANDAQRAALIAGLRDTLTVVTGPPGTGKSQLVTNLIASAWASSQSVLVVSTNNQAVDVACARAQQIHSGMVIRTGSKEHRDKARETLESLSSSSASLPDRAAVVADLEATRLRCDEARTQLESRSVAESRLAEVLLGQESLNSGGRISSSKVPQLIGKPGSATRWLQRVRRTRAALLLRKWRMRRLGNKCGLDLHDFGEVVERYLELEAERLGLQRTILASADAGALVRTVLETEEIFRNSSVVFVRSQVQRAIQEGRVSIRSVIQARVVGKHNGLAEAFPGVLADLRAWASTALSVGATVPLKPNLFDLVVIDEASQCAIGQIIPVLFRARRAVIIGDAKQLSHISGFGWSDDKQKQAAAGLDEATVVARKLSHLKNSIFDVMEARAGKEHTILLDEHYRSHPQIIEISNRLFYGGRLTILTDPKSLLTFGPHAVAWRHISGRAARPDSGSAMNGEEAEAVAEEVAALVNRKSGASIGVVTPFSAQARYIQNLLERRLSAEDIALASLTVGTAHTFQGDERDVMVFSPVASEGLLPSTLGWLSGTPNLFNVAITRARSYLLVVGNRTFCSQLGGPLSALAQYVQSLETDRLIERAEHAGKLHSEPERRLFAAMLEAGLAADPKISIRGYECDFVLRSGDTIINIECDGRHHLDNAGRLRLQDRARDALIGQKGWKVIRFPAWRCLMEPKMVVEELRSVVSAVPAL